MQIPQIRMQSRLAQIELSTTPPQQSIEQHKANVNLQQPKAEMTMETTPGGFTIDQTMAWEAMDIKHIYRRIEENAAKGRSDASSGTGRRASEGDELMRIENGGSPIVSQATRKSGLLDYDYNTALVPPPFSVKMNYHPGTLNIQVNPKPVVNNTDAQKPIIDYQKGQVNAAMKQHAELNIDYSI